MIFPSLRQHVLWTRGSVELFLYFMSNYGSRCCDNYLNFNFIMIKIVNVAFRPEFLSKASKINIQNIFYTSCFQF